MAQNFANATPPVAATNNQHVFNLGIHQHRHVNDHLMIGRFVLLATHHHFVYGEHFAVLKGVEDFDELVGRSFLEDADRPYAE